MRLFVFCAHYILRARSIPSSSTSPSAVRCSGNDAQTHRSGIDNNRMSVSLSIHRTQCTCIVATASVRDSNGNGWAIRICSASDNDTDKQINDAKRLMESMNTNFSLFFWQQIQQWNSRRAVFIRQNHSFSHLSLYNFRYCR